MLLFVDESGHDFRASPYAVLAGLAISERRLWPLVQRIHESVEHHFGMPVASLPIELKGRKILKRQALERAHSLPPIEESERRTLARRCLEKGREKVQQSFSEVTAFRQAGVAYVSDVLSICEEYQVRAFASIVDRNAPRPDGKDFLRKDYSYLFQRYHAYLIDMSDAPEASSGLIIFDELDRSQCHILIDQMRRYFIETKRGRERSERIVPEPFFVHSDLTTMIQCADFVAYIIAWGVRIRGMDLPVRPGLRLLGEQVKRLRFRSRRPSVDDGFEHYVWGFTHISDLRPRSQQ